MHVDTLYDVKITGVFKQQKHEINDILCAVVKRGSQQTDNFIECGWSGFLAKSQVRLTSQTPR